MTALPSSPARIGIVAAGGPMPFAVADSLIAGGRTPFLFALKGVASPADVAHYPHHWIAFGQFGRLFRLLRHEGCHEIVFIGTVDRPVMSELRFDLATLRAMPVLFKAFRGGDDNLLSTAAGIFERKGFRLLGSHDVAPDLLIPAGCVTRRKPDTDAETDIAKGLAVLSALSPFDVGQTAVVIDGHVIGIEGIEGTDALLARVTQLRAEGRLRKKTGRGVMVKAPKQGQDLRFDLPTAGPRTIEGIAAAQLAGLAVVARQTFAAELTAMIGIADRNDLFIVGVSQQ